MMWYLIFPVLAALLFGAHLFFWGNYFWLIYIADLLICLLIPFRPIVWLWQISLAVFAVEWWISAYGLYMRRVAYGQPFALGVSILAVCGILTLLSALSFRNKAIRRRYALKKDSDA